METGRTPFRVSTASLLPAPIRPLVQPFESAVQRFLFPDQLLRSYTAAEMNDGASAFSDRLLHELDIRYELPEGDLERIPKSGAALIVANHPFGLLEGLILFSLLEKVRRDYRIVANSLLSSVAPLQNRLVFVNPFQTQAVPHENSKSLRVCLEWLHTEGLLAFFPAGEVAHLNFQETGIVDPKWNTTAARFARKLGCPVVPVYFDGANSYPFQLMGTLHPAFRTLGLPRQLLNKRSRTIQLRIGNPVPAATLRGYADVDAATEYLRSRTYLLRNRSQESDSAIRGSRTGKAEQIAAPEPEQVLADEVAALPPERLLISSDEFYVYCAPANEIPHTLREIARCRELTFRQIGEGTRNRLDLDSFDEYYQHLFLWSRKDARIAGAYRLAATIDVLPTRGIKGLYTNTLFRFEPAFFERIGPAFELGRSFICREYQKHYAPLLLLWKGIARCIERRPQCAVLFGAVSISSDYHAISRELIVNFLNGRVSTEIAGWVKPRRGFRTQAFVPKYVKRLSRLLSSVEELSSSVADVETDRKGVPVLIRHYLKVGGQLLGFNIDPSFSNAVDALLLADLRTASPAMLDRCMGRSGASAFRAWHAEQQSNNPVLQPVCTSNTASR